MSSILMHGHQPYFGSSGRNFAPPSSLPCPSQGPVFHTKFSCGTFSTSNTWFMAGYSICQGMKREKNESPGGQRTEQESGQSLGRLPFCQENRRFSSLRAQEHNLRQENTPIATQKQSYVLHLLAGTLYFFLTPHTSFKGKTSFVFFFRATNKQAIVAVMHSITPFAVSPLPGEPFSFALNRSSAVPQISRKNWSSLPSFLRRMSDWSLFHFSSRTSSKINVPPCSLITP